METHKRDEIIFILSELNECFKIISSSLRISLICFYPQKINIISYLWGSRSSWAHTQEISTILILTNNIMKGCK